MCITLDFLEFASQERAFTALALGILQGVQNPHPIKLNRLDSWFQRCKVISLQTNFLFATSHFSQKLDVIWRFEQRFRGSIF